jgi:hypothetical protein
MAIKTEAVASKSNNEIFTAAFTSAIIMVAGNYKPLGLNTIQYFLAPLYFFTCKYTTWKIQQSKMWWLLSIID